MSDTEGRYVRVVITTDVLVTDPTWDDQTVRENLIDYVEAAIDHAEQRNRLYHALNPDDEPSAYELLTEDVTVFLADDFVADLADIAALPTAERTAMADLANLPPEERRTFWYSGLTRGAPT